MKGDQYGKVVLTSTPSLLYNNLTCGGGQLSFVHLNLVQQASEASAVSSPEGSDEPTAPELTKVAYKDTSIVYQARHVSLGEGRGALVLATGTGVQIFDSEGRRLLFSCPVVPGGGAGANANATPAFMRGIAAVMCGDGTAQVCVGASNGAIAVISAEQQESFRLVTTLGGDHSHPITAIASEFDGRQGKGSPAPRGQMVSCDQEGKVIVWQAAGPSVWNKVWSIPAQGSPAVGLACRGDVLALGLGKGLLQLYSMGEKRICQEVVAHSRWMAAMELHPTEDRLATGAEDATIAVWQLPAGADGELGVVLSTTWTDHMITGLAWTGEGHLAVVAYDTDNARVYWGI